MFSFIFNIFSLNEYSIKFKSQITGFIIKVISTVVEATSLVVFHFSFAMDHRTS